MTSDYTEPAAQLLAYGDPREEKNWPNYLSLGLTEEHVPELIKMATDVDLNWTSSESPEVWAPVHAWRALGQLKAEQAIEPLMVMFEFCVDFDDDWVLSEFPTVYAMIGPKAISALATYLSDNSTEVMPGILIVDCINGIGKTHPDAKFECTQVLSTQLERFRQNASTLNGFLISGLVGLQAIDRLSLIRQAFDNGRVDLSIMGDMEDVEIEFNVREEWSTPPPPHLGRGRSFHLCLKATVQTSSRKHQRSVEMIRALAVAGESTRNAVSTNEETRKQV